MLSAFSEAIMDHNKFPQNRPYILLDFTISTEWNLAIHGASIYPYKDQFQNHMGFLGFAFMNPKNSNQAIW